MSATAHSLPQQSLSQLPAALAAEEAATVCQRRSEDHKILKRSVAASLGLHIAGVLVVLFYHWLSETDLQGKAHDLDITVSFVPLSALDTNLAQGVQRPSPVQEPKPAEPAPPPKPKVEKSQPVASSEAKKLAPKKAKEPPQEQAEHSAASQKPEDARASMSSSALGVPNGTGDPSEPARISYQDMVATMLSRSKRYPESALRRHTTGEGAIRVKIASGGDVVSFEIVRSTSSPILDEELQEMVERAAPFPPFPSGLSKDSLSIVVPVSFELN